MKKKVKLWPGLVISFIVGVLLSLVIAYIFFTYIPEGTILKSLTDAIIWTLGLPFLFSLWVASSEWVKELLCSPYGQSTFGCWAGNSFRLSLLVYGGLFALLYYYLIWQRRKR